MTKKVSNNPVGGPTKWGTAKKRVNVTLTPTAIEGLDKLAKEFDGVSRSEFVERVGRGEITAIEFSESERQKLEAWAERENETISHLVIGRLRLEEVERA